jgi:hypothetical protein
MSHIERLSCGTIAILDARIAFSKSRAKVYVFDHIRHGTALEILSRASAACRFESPHTAVSEHQWREYFGLPVMSLSAAASYYGLKYRRLNTTFAKKILMRGAV